MKVLKNIFQAAATPAFLILFVFGLMGAGCGGVTGGGGDSTQDQDAAAQALAERQAKIDAAKNAAEEQRRKEEEAQRKADAARQAGDAAKAAAEEKKRQEAAQKRKEAEALAEKHRQIKTVLQPAIADGLRAHKAVERVAAAKKQVEGTHFASGKPFSVLETEVKKAHKEALAANSALAKITEVSAAFDQAEKTALAANKAEKQAQTAEGFVNSFQAAFTFNGSEKSVFSSPTSSVKSQCAGYLQALFQPLPSGLAPSFVVRAPCITAVQRGPTSLTYNCSCEYVGGTTFYKK